MDALTVLIAVAVIAIIWHIAVTMIICARLSALGEKINWPFIRMMYPAYAARYRRIVQTETGHDAPLFYHWVVSVNIALVAVIVAILIAL